MRTFALPVFLAPLAVGCELLFPPADDDAEAVELPDTDRGGKDTGDSGTPKDSADSGETDSTDTNDSAESGPSYEDGILAWWPLESTDVRNVSGNGFAGTVTGTTAIAGKVGNALNFDGVDDLVSIGTDSRCRAAGGLSVAAWVRVSAPAAYGAIVTKRSCCTDADTFEWSLQNNEGVPAFGVFAGAAVSWAGASPYELDTWTLVVGVYDGTNTLLYVDGGLVSTTEAAGEPAEHDVAVTLGARQDPSGYADFWAGAMDEVRLWNRALSADEVAELCAAER